MRLGEQNVKTFTGVKIIVIMRFAMKEMNDNDIQDDFEQTQEDIPETDELEDIEENSAQKIKKLQQKLKVCEKEKAEHLEDLQRAKADFLNGKRRLEEERIRDKERAVSDQIERLLPLCDSFQMAMSDTDAWESIDETWRKGIEGIYTQLQRILSSYGVTEIHPTGEAFDPQLHEALTNVPVSDKKDHHKVITVIQNGFTRTVNGTEILIRPARVTVGEYKNN